MLFGNVGDGALLIAITQVLPQLLQDQFGYTATWAGLAISPGGAVTMGMMLIVGRLGSVQPKYLITARRDYRRLRHDRSAAHDAGRRFLVFRLVTNLSGHRAAAIFKPITTASYDGLPPEKTVQASALINLARNFGGSMGVSLSQTVLARREQFHQERLAENVGVVESFLL